MDSYAPGRALGKRKLFEGACPTVLEALQASRGGSLNGLRVGWVDRLLLFRG